VSYTPKFSQNLKFGGQPLAQQAPTALCVCSAIPSGRANFHHYHRTLATTHNYIGRVCTRDLGFIQCTTTRDTWAKPEDCVGVHRRPTDHEKLPLTFEHVAMWTSLDSRTSPVHLKIRSRPSYSTALVILVAPVTKTLLALYNMLSLFAGRQESFWKRWVVFEATS
jgi:hypothetical protein